MAINKKTVRKVTRREFSTARKANLATCRHAAFNAGTSRNALVASIRVACGPRPVQTLSDAVRFETVLGLMAAALARKGDNRPESELTEHCRIRLTKYQAHGGKGKLKPKMLSRRTKVEEEAYASARVQWSKLCSDAGVKLPTKSGSNSTGRKPRPASKATAKKAANDTRPVSRKFANKAALVTAFKTEAAAMLVAINKNAALAPNELKSAVQDFKAAIDKLA